MNGDIELENENDPRSISLIGAMSGWMIALIVFMVIWALIGAIGFVMSVICFTKGDWKKNLGFNIGGLVMALFLGPFYWIYFFALRSKGYCKG